MKKVRLFNLTDVATPSLEKKGWVSVVVGGDGFAIRPGESVEVMMRPDLLPTLQNYVRDGVLAVNSLPAAYRVQKDKKGSR